MLHDEIYESLLPVKVVNTHEHLFDEKTRLEMNVDWSRIFFHYGSAPLVQAGMTWDEYVKFFTYETPHDEKWQIFSKYYPICKNVSCIKAAVISIEKVYGVDRVDSDAMQEVNRRIGEASKPGMHRRVLRDIANIDYCMINAIDTEFEEKIPARLWGDRKSTRLNSSH